jgi:hypothetical protein
MKMFARLSEHRPDGSENQIAVIEIPTRMRKVRFAGPHGEMPIEDELAEIPDLINFRGTVFAPNDILGRLPAEEMLTDDPEDEQQTFDYKPAWIFEAKAD